MRVFGLLSFYAEKPEHLTAAITSFAAAGIDHLVACDGAYELFPDATASSGRDCHDAIRQAAHDSGIGCTIHIPPGPWQDNEIEKRTAMFRLAHEFAEPREDWLFVFDADETVVEAGDFRGQLEAAEHDVAVIEHGEPGVRPRLERRLFRAHPGGIRVELAHYYYLDGDDRVLWGPGQIDREVVAVRVLHQPLRRSHERNKARETYYEHRLITQAEAVTY